MPKIKLLSDYRHLKAGEITEQWESKCEDLVKDGRAEYVEKPKKYSNKMMTSVYTCPVCKKQYKSKAYFDKHVAKCK